MGQVARLVVRTGGAGSCLSNVNYFFRPKDLIVVDQTKIETPKNLVLGVPATVGSQYARMLRERDA